MSVFQEIFETCSSILVPHSMKIYIFAFVFKCFHSKKHILQKRSLMPLVPYSLSSCQQLGVHMFLPNGHVHSFSSVLG